MRWRKLLKICAIESEFYEWKFGRKLKEESEINQRKYVGRELIQRFCEVFEEICMVS
jgi:hypothetical protein